MKRLFLQVCADGSADAVSFCCADQQTVLYAYVGPERAADRAAFVEADIRTNVQADDTPVSQADSVERAPLNIVCLVSPTLPTPPALP